MESTAIVYHNSTMGCEGFHRCCPNFVARVYHPFCLYCYKSAIRKGSFKSRDGLTYRFDGRHWIVDVGTVGEYKGVAA